MTDVNQVRINELARELEVKAKAIIDLLPGYGVTEKKTHSSSIPEDVAEKVRKKIQGVAEEEAHAEAAAKADKDRKSTRLNSSHQIISYAVFCLKKKNNQQSTAVCRAA